MIKTILLDLDGPLLDGKYRHYQCYADILSSNGFAAMPMDAYWKMKRARKSRREQLGVSGAESIYETFLDEWLRNIEKPEYLALDRVQDGAIEQLQAWHEQGIAVVLVTMRSSWGALMSQLETTGLLPWFASVVVCEHANSGKGKALALLREFPDIAPVSCLWIGDTEADCEAARFLGCPVCLLMCGLRERDYLASLEPDFLHENLTELELEKMIEHGA